MAFFSKHGLVPNEFKVPKKYEVKSIGPSYYRLSLYQNVLTSIAIFLFFT